MKWISVENDLPSEGEVVNIICENGGETIFKEGLLKNGNWIILDETSDVVVKEWSHKNEKQ